MILLPSYSKLDNYRLYRDSEDPSLIYVDALQPSPAHGTEAIHWLPLPYEQAYLVGEVLFGPREEGLQQIVTSAPDQRTVPVPWESGPVYAWSREGDNVQILARGNTSGYGFHNAIFNATVPVQAALSPLAIATELFYWGKLANVRVQGRGDPKVIQEALSSISVGVRAHWSATLAEVLFSWLREMGSRQVLTVTVEPTNLSQDALQEVHELVLMEWAHRIVTSCSTAPVSVALPAAEISSLTLSQPVEMSLDWNPGSIIPVRNVRVLHSQGEIAPAQGPDTSATTPIVVIVSPDSDWTNFAYVEVWLKSGEASTKITLTRTKSVALWKPGSQEASSPSLQAEASGGVWKFGVTVPLKDIHITANRVSILLTALEEQAFLVRADRELLRQTGPLEVTLEHPTLARILVPSQGPLVLSPDNGNLPQVSVVCRALLWKRARIDPFTMTIRFSSAISVNWFDWPRNGEIMITSALLPFLRVVTSVPGTSAPVGVELSQGASEVDGERTSLGIKEIGPEELVVWVYDPKGGDLWMRTRYPGLGEEMYWTAWHRVFDTKSTVIAPRTHHRRVIIIRPGQPDSSSEVEVAPTVGDGGTVHITATAVITKAELLEDERGGAIRYRTRPQSDLHKTEALPWSSWTVIEGSVIKLNPASDSTSA